MPVVDRGERRNGVDHEQRRMARPVDRLARRGDARGDPGRGLVVHHAHRLDPVPAVVGEARPDLLQIDAMAPVPRQQLHLEPEPASHLAPQRREMAGLRHQHRVARRQRVDQRRLPRAGAGRGIDHHRTRRPEHRLQVFQDAGSQPRELGAAVIDSRTIHGAEDPVRDVGGSRNLQEVAPAVMSRRHAGLPLGLARTDKPMHYAWVETPDQASPGARMQGVVAPDRAWAWS